MEDGVLAAEAGPAVRPSSVRVCVIIAVTLGAVGPKSERCLGDG